MIVGSHALCNHRLSRVETQRREVHRVGTHIGDQSRLIKFLCNAHGRSHGVAKFAGCFLLQRRGRKRRRRGALRGFGGETLNAEISCFAVFQESIHLFYRSKAMVQFCFQCHRLSVFAWHTKEGGHAEGTFSLESLNFALALHDEPHRDALHTSCGEVATHLSPQHGREAEAKHTVKHATCLLRIHEIQIDGARMCNSIEDGWLGNFVKDDASCRSRIQFQDFRKVP